MSKDLVFVGLNISPVMIAAFKNAGFAERTYEGQEGVFLAKDFLSNEVEMIAESLPDDLDPPLDFVVEVCPDGNIQFSTKDSDLEAFAFFDAFDPQSQPKQWRKLAQDAGVSFPSYD